MTEIHMTEVLIGLNTLFLGIVGYFLRRALEKLDRLDLHKETCLREFATKAEATELFELVRGHGEKIAGLESWRQIVERKL